MNIIILAAGQGKRMYSALPKVLHKLAGKTLLAHVIDTAQTLSPSKVCVVYGHGGEAVPKAFAGRHLGWVRQEPQRTIEVTHIQARVQIWTTDKNAKY